MVDNYFELPLISVQATRVVSIKLDTIIISKLDELAEKLRFKNRSRLIRFILCSVLEELEMLSEEEKTLCYEVHRYKKMWEENPDSELLQAIIDTVFKIKLREDGISQAPPILDYAFELSEALS